MGIYVLSVNTCPRLPLSLYVLLFICAVRSQRWTQLGRKMDSWVTIEILVKLVGESRTEENTPKKSPGTSERQMAWSCPYRTEEWQQVASSPMDNQALGSAVGPQQCPSLLRSCQSAFSSWGSWCQFMLCFQQGSHGTTKPTIPLLCSQATHLHYQSPRLGDLQPGAEHVPKHLRNEYKWDHQGGPICGWVVSAGWAGRKEPSQHPWRWSLWNTTDTHSAWLKTGGKGRQRKFSTQGL